MLLFDNAKPILPVQVSRFSHKFPGHICTRSEFGPNATSFQPCGDVFDITDFCNNCGFWCGYNEGPLPRVILDPEAGARASWPDLAQLDRYTNIRMLHRGTIHNAHVMRHTHKEPWKKAAKMLIQLVSSLHRTRRL